MKDRKIASGNMLEIKLKDPLKYFSWNEISDHQGMKFRMSDVY